MATCRKKVRIKELNLLMAMHFSHLWTSLFFAFLWTTFTIQNRHHNKAKMDSFHSNRLIYEVFPLLQSGLPKVAFHLLVWFLLKQNNGVILKSEKNQCYYWRILPIFYFRGFQNSITMYRSKNNLNKGCRIWNLDCICTIRYTIYIIGVLF